MTNKELLDDFRQLAQTTYSQLEQMTKKMDGLDIKIDGLTTRVDGLEIKIDGSEIKTDGLASKKDLVTSESRIMKKIEETKTSLTKRMDDGFATLNTFTITVDQDVSLLKLRATHLESRLS